MQDQHALQPGSILDRYRIIRVLGEGGFGITYLAEDIQLGLKVVIKEYFPNEFAMRSGNSTITAKSKSLGDFAKGMQRFKEEAQTLAKFNHPSIVKILGYFEANDTAYFVMEYEEGIDLSQYLKQENRALRQEEILSIMMPILEGLKEVHRYNYLHRDIKPGNILLRSNKSAVLIDFGASKLALGEASKSITSMLTEGYAPLEQYSTDVKRQGPFTDLYAVAAVMYKMIVGKVPPSAQTRSYELLSDDNDPLKPLSNMNLSGYDVSFLSAIDRALSLKGKDRPQSVQEFQKDIAGQLKNEVSDVPKQKKSPKSPMFLMLFLILIGGLYYLYSLDDQGGKISNGSLVMEIDKEKAKEEKKHIEEKRLAQEARDELLRREKEEQVQKEKLESERLKKESENKAGEDSSRWTRTGEVVTDSKLGLMWQDNVEAKTVRKNWKEAKYYCENLSFSGHSDWRLPNYEELQSIVDYDRNKPAIMQSFKNVSTSDYYWSSSVSVSNTKGAWIVNFYNGDTNYNGKANEDYVRCVRGRQ